MSNENIKTLEGMISSYIHNMFSDEPPTEEQFNDAANIVRTSTASFLPVSDDEFKYIKGSLRQSVVVTLDTGICLQDINNGHKSWLPGKRADIEFYFWERYKKYLVEEKNWNPRVTSKLGLVSDEILDHCGDPSGDNFHIRGLVLGDVQSGKTANYTALANKAADVGYDLIIVLAGIPEILRQQTQKRLDSEFVGRQNKFLDPKFISANNWVGVGRYGQDQNKKIACFTSEANDFDANVLKSNGLSLDSVNCTILLVVKKNSKILRNLYSWLRHNNSINSNGQISKSLFLIDDEADYASINTNQTDNENDPTAINRAIRLLLSIFSKTTYLAVTATPFANIFINSTQESDLKLHHSDGINENLIKNVPDLFPADFIYALDQPSNYIGADAYFSDTGNHKNSIEIIDSSEFLKHFPDKHKKNLSVNNLPKDLYEALYYFLLTNAIRDERGDNTEHRSMMVHVSRYINVQKQIADQIYYVLDLVKSDLKNYSVLPTIKSEQIATIQELHNVWLKYKLDNKCNTKWDVILKNYLYRAVAPIDVKTVNSETGASSLDYDGHKKDGLRVIAVGGNTLSRGLTLEGLVVTYFYRNTHMYDTLMQMGRWFGYRPNYEDLVKIWLSSDAVDWFSQINEATLDLKDQIYKMKAARLTPRDFGLKVRQDPGSLTVTARNKMRSAQVLKCPISVSGRLLETPRLVASLEVLNNNAEIIEGFIDRLSFEGKRVPTSVFRTNNNYFWEGVSSDYVSALLAKFKTHPWHMSYNGIALADYVSKHHWPNGWDVVLINKGEGKSFYKRLKCGEELLEIKATERRSISISENMLSIDRNKLKVGSGGCTRIGLEKGQIEEAQIQFYRNYKGKSERPSPSDSSYMIKDRNPILMIHIINADYNQPNSKFPDFLYALGVGFPSDDSGNEVATYMVNLVELKYWIDFDDDIDE